MCACVRDKGLVQVLHSDSVLKFCNCQVARCLFTISSWIQKLHECIAHTCMYVCYCMVSLSALRSVMWLNWQDSEMSFDRLGWNELGHWLGLTVEQ